MSVTKIAAGFFSLLILSGYCLPPIAQHGSPDTIHAIFTD